MRKIIALFLITFIQLKAMEHQEPQATSWFSLFVGAFNKKKEYVCPSDFLAALPQDLKKLLVLYIPQAVIQASSLEEALTSLQKIAKLKLCVPFFSEPEFQHLFSLPELIKQTKSIQEALQKVKEVADYKVLAPFFNSPDFARLLTKCILNTHRRNTAYILEDYMKALETEGARIWLKRNNQQNQFLKAATEGNAAIVQNLLEQGVNINVQDNNYGTALVRAVQGKCINVVKVLLMYHAHIDLQSKSIALTQAAYDGYEELVKMLLDVNVDPNSRDNNGNTPLMVAAKNGQTAIVELLLAYNADSNAQWYILDYTQKLYNQAEGRTALIEAVQKGHKDVVQILLERGAAADIQEKYSGNTALIYAARLGYQDIVKILLAYGARVDCRNSSGKTALDMAEEKKHSAISSILRTARDN